MLKHVTAFLSLFSLSFHSGFAQCNLEQRSLYGDKIEISNFTKLGAWTKDLNHDGVKDTIVKYQIEKGSNNGRPVRFPASKGLIVLGQKNQQGECKQVYHRFSKFIKSTQIDFGKNKFCITTTSGTANITNSTKNCFNYSKQGSFELAIHQEKSRYLRPSGGYFRKTYKYQTNYDSKEFLRKTVLKPNRHKPNLKETESWYQKLLISENNHFSKQALSKINRKKFVTYQQENWEGAKDLSFTMGSKWDKEALSFKFKVKDDNLVLAKKPSNMLKQDHLELWFDFTGIHDVMKDCRTNENGKYPQAAKAKHRVQLLVSLKQGGKMPANYNDKEFEVKGIQRSFQSTEEGYQVNLTIPVEFFWHYFNIDYHPKKGHKLGFTAMISDTDKPEDPQQDCLMGTSQLSYGDPSTIGVLKLVEDWQRPVFEDEAYDF